MSLRRQIIGDVPEETERIAHAAFPKGNVYMRMRDELGTFYEDQQFASVFSTRGQPAESPWRLALISIMQFAENLTDRQAADAVRARIDWKYALGLEVTDPGFHYSVLSEFRDRLIEGGIEMLLLDSMLETFRELGLLKTRGQQRTDSTHILAAVRSLNRLESVGETLRAALNAVAVAAPDWLIQHSDPTWFDRYGHRFEEYRLPKAETERNQMHEQIGRDGIQLLTDVYAPAAPTWLREIPAVQRLRQTWVHQYYYIDGQLRRRAAKDLPPAGLRFDSPYDAEAHYGTKRNINWVGYKLHLTEACDPDLPHLILHIETTPAARSDVDMTEPIHEALQRKDLLPDQHVVDAGYVDAQLLVSSPRDYQVELIGPVRPNVSWQTQAGAGYDISDFQVDWDNRLVTCPQRQITRYWKHQVDAWGNDVIQVRFSRTLCGRCEVRSLCTKSKEEPRHVTFRHREEHQALQLNRQQEQTPAWQATYARRAGVEGALSQGIRAFGLREARYFGQAKTHLQHVLTAAAMNLIRVDQWLTGTPFAQTRTSRFEALRPIPA
jgi:transposase